MISWRKFTFSMTLTRWVECSDIGSGLKQGYEISRTSSLSFYHLIVKIFCFNSHPAKDLGRNIIETQCVFDIASSKRESLSHTSSLPRIAKPCSARFTLPARAFVIPTRRSLERANTRIANYGLQQIRLVSRCSLFALQSPQKRNQTKNSPRSPSSPAFGEKKLLRALCVNVCLYEDHGSSTILIYSIINLPYFGMRGGEKPSHCKRMVALFFYGLTVSNLMEFE